MNQLAIIALGSNLGDSLSILREAMQRLESLSDGPILRSSFWQTSPVDCPPGSPPFINAVVAINPFPDETPETLLEKLQELEKAFGRKPKVVLNEPRPLDLDLVAFGNEVRNSSALVLPHPRAHLRQFVLRPLAEIAPDFLLPGQEQTVIKLLASVNTAEQLERIGQF